MKIERTETEKARKFKFPVPLYFIVKFLDQNPKVGDLMHALECYTLRNDIEKIEVDRPIYLTGLARSGTTITLEMLNEHPETATHKHYHMVCAYWPHWAEIMSRYVPVMKKPAERIHKDGIFVTQDSPEAVEELFWQKYWDESHNESISNILNSSSQNSTFEIFYDYHIKKLLYNQRATRYLAKNMYNITRMEYIQKLYPDVKFIILIRNPLNHIASYAKQDRFFTKREQSITFLLDWVKMIGHREFGSAKACVNVDNSEKNTRNSGVMGKRRYIYQRIGALLGRSV